MKNSSEVKSRSKRAAEREFGGFLLRLMASGKIARDQFNESNQQLARGRQINPLDL